MGAPQYEQAGADIGGTGTTNTIPRWTGASTLGDSGITDNGTVIGVANGTRTLLFNLVQVSGNQVNTPGAGELAIQYATNKNTVIYNGSSPALFVNGTSGSVGIGTASPTAKLEIPSTASLAGIRVQLAAAPKNNYHNAEVHYFRNLSDLNRVAVDTVNNYLDVSFASGWGLKLPATPGNADTQTLDCYAETTLNSGFTTSGITSTGTFTVTARATRIGRAIALTIRIAPSGGASLTFASGWNITLTGMPQMPIEGPLAATSSDATVGRNSVQVSQDATPILYGGTTGAYALGANVSLNVSGIIT